MSRFTTFLALMVGGMEVIQPAAAGVLVDLTARIDLGPVHLDLQRRQTLCGLFCSPVTNIIASNSCPPSHCCSASFETAYFNCLVCVANVVQLTDYTVPQSNIDQLYDQCANLGIQLPVLTFPGQSPNRSLSSVAPSSPSSQTTVSTITFVSLPSLIQPTGSTVASSSTSPATTTALADTPTPTSSLPSSVIRSVETSCFNLIASTMMLRLWFYFLV